MCYDFTVPNGIAQAYQLLFHQHLVYLGKCCLPVKKLRRNWNILAKQVGQLAPGYWTAPFIAAPFLIFAYAHLQISFRLDDYLVMYSLILCFFFTCFFFLFHPRPNGRNINAGSFFIASHIVPLFVSWSAVGWPRWRLSFKLLDTLDFSLSFLPYSHTLSSCFKQQQQHQKLYLHDHKGITVLQKLLI